MRRSALPLAVWALVSALAPLAVPSLARADVVYLKDGGKVEGEILRKTGDGWVIRTPDGAVSTIEAGKVKSFEARRGNGNAGTGNAGAGGGPPAPAVDEPTRALASFRRSVEGQTDIKKVLDRYRKFIEQYVGTPAGDEALKDVAVWEQRLDQSMVKVGDRWLTPQEQGELKGHAVERALAARKLLIEGKVKDATAEIDAALVEDPQCAAAHYLRGVAAFRQNQPSIARKAFDTVVQASPEHAPSLNNIAVLMWNAKQLPGALNVYGQAMNAAPGTRHILDNVAEALNDLPENQRDNEVTKKVVLLFNAQDMAVQARLKKQGVFRWGSTWVNEKEFKTLQAEEKRIEDRIAQLEEEFEEVQDRLEQIGRDIGDTERSIRRIEASSYGRDATGRPVRLSYPRLYYDLKRDLDALYGERDIEQEKTSRLRKKARQVKQELSVPPYTGVQQIMGVEGAPDLPPLTEDELPKKESEPTTAPTTKESLGANAE